MENFYTSATDRCVEGIIFTGRPSVRECVRASVHTGVRPVSKITPERLKDFNRILYKLENVAKPGLMVALRCFSRSQSLQGQIKIE